ACRTRRFLLVGAEQGGYQRSSLSQTPGLDAYGSEAEYVNNIEGHDSVLTQGLTDAMVRFATRHEYARTVEDVLARRSRLLFLDARLAGALAPRIAEIMREETGTDPRLSEFLILAEHYLRLP